MAAAYPLFVKVQVKHCLNIQKDENAGVLIFLGGGANTKSLQNRNEYHIAFVG